MHTERNFRKTKQIKTMEDVDLKMEKPTVNQPKKKTEKRKQHQGLKKIKIKKQKALKIFCG